MSEKEKGAATNGAQETTSKPILAEAPGAVKKWRKVKLIAQDVANSRRSPPCKDCGKVVEPMTKDGRPLFKHFDNYIVRDEVWAEVGMEGWASGSLCTPCLIKRLGRELTDDDYLWRTLRATSKYLECEVCSDYFNRPSTKHLGNPEWFREVKEDDEVQQ